MSLEQTLIYLFLLLAGIGEYYFLEPVCLSLRKYIQQRLQQAKGMTALQSGTVQAMNV